MEEHSKYPHGAQGQLQMSDGVGVCSSIHMDMEVGGLCHHPHDSDQELTPRTPVKRGGNNSPGGDTKTKAGEQIHPSISTGFIWTPLASMLAMGASRHHQHSVPLTDNVLNIPITWGHGGGD